MSETGTTFARWVDQQGRSVAALAVELQCHRTAVYSYRRGSKMPRPGVVARIERLTCGAVTAADLNRDYSGRNRDMQWATDVEDGKVEEAATRLKEHVGGAGQDVRVFAFMESGESRNIRPLGDTPEAMSDAIDAAVEDHGPSPIASFGVWTHARTLDGAEAE